MREFEMPSVPVAADDASVRDLVSNRLRKAGCQVDVARTVLAI